MGTEAFVRTLLGDKDEAFRLLKEISAESVASRAVRQRRQLVVAAQDDRVSRTW
jgi:hypothetical protein